MSVSDLSVGLVQYCIGTEYLYALLINQEGKTQRFRLSSCANAAPAVHLLLDVLEQPYAWTPTQRGKVVQDFVEGWGRQLLPPADVLRFFDILIFVPHHFLHGVPLHLVRCGEQPLATTHGVAYCSSSTLLARCVTRNRARQFDTQHWTFPSDNDDSPPNGPPVSTCVSYGMDVLTDKEAAYRELAHAFSAQFSKKREAFSREEIKSFLDVRQRARMAAMGLQPDAICLVCHGYYDPVRADQSGLLLTKSKILGRTRRPILVHGDTVLRVLDLPFAEVPLRLDPIQPQSALFGEPEVLATSELRVQCETDAQLIALFGCSTGTGVIASNDDYISLAYQWLKAGAASVIANLWEADLSIITDWAQRFAVNWVQRRQPKAIAARDATRALLANRPALGAESAVWGSLAVLGDWL